MAHNRMFDVPLAQGYNHPGRQSVNALYVDTVIKATNTYDAAGNPETWVVLLFPSNWQQVYSVEAEADAVFDLWVSRAEDAR